MTVITTAGEAYLEVEPEFAIVHVNVWAVEPDRALAVRAATDRAAAARGLTDAVGAAIERVETGGVSVWPEHDPTGRRITGYRAGMSTQVRVVDFTVLGDLLARLAELQGVDLHGPMWQLRPDSPHYRAARLAAVDDALRRARDYAAALGTEVIGVLEVSDSGLLSDGRRDQSGGFGAPMMARATMAEAAPVFDVAPARQHVHARIEARFDVCPPEL